MAGAGQELAELQVSRATRCNKCGVVKTESGNAVADQLGETRGLWNKKNGRCNTVLSCVANTEKAFGRDEDKKANIKAEMTEVRRVKALVANFPPYQTEGKEGGAPTPAKKSDEDKALLELIQEPFPEVEELPDLGEARSDWLLFFRALNCPAHSQQVIEVWEKARNSLTPSPHKLFLLRMEFGEEPIQELYPEWATTEWKEYEGIVISSIEARLIAMELREEQGASATQQGEEEEPKNLLEKIDEGALRDLLEKNLENAKTPEARTEAITAIKAAAGVEGGKSSRQLDRPDIAQFGQKTLNEVITLGMTLKHFKFFGKAMMKLKEHQNTQESSTGGKAEEGATADKQDGGNVWQAEAETAQRQRDELIQLLTTDIALPVGKDVSAQNKRLWEEIDKDGEKGPLKRAEQYQRLKKRPKAEEAWIKPLFDRNKKIEEKVEEIMAELNAGKS